MSGLPGAGDVTLIRNAKKQSEGSTTGAMRIVGVDMAIDKAAQPGAGSFVSRFANRLQVTRGGGQMAIWRIITLFGVGLFIVAAQGPTNSLAKSTFVWDGLCSCNISGPGFSCHFQRWLQGPNSSDLRSKCAAQTNGHGVLSRLQNIELRGKKLRH